MSTDNKPKKGISMPDLGNEIPSAGNDLYNEVYNERETAPEFSERDWVKKGKAVAERSVDNAMDEVTAFAYGYMHGAREYAETFAKPQSTPELPDESEVKKLKGLLRYCYGFVKPHEYEGTNGILVKTLEKLLDIDTGIASAESTQVASTEMSEEKITDQIMRILGYSTADLKRSEIWEVTGLIERCKDIWIAARSTESPPKIGLPDGDISEAGKALANSIYEHCVRSSMLETLGQVKWVMKSLREQGFRIEPITSPSNLQTEPVSGERLYLFEESIRHSFKEREDKHLERIRELEDEREKLYAELIGQEHRLGTANEQKDERIAELIELVELNEIQDVKRTNYRIELEERIAELEAEVKELKFERGDRVENGVVIRIMSYQELNKQFCSLLGQFEKLRVERNKLKTELEKMRDIPSVIPYSPEFIEVAQSLMRTHEVTLLKLRISELEATLTALRNQNSK